jgi:hypothetical protein
MDRLDGLNGLNWQEGERERERERKRENVAISE